MAQIAHDVEKKDDVFYPAQHLEGPQDGAESQLVINALHGQTKDQLRDGVQTFVKAHHLDEYEELFYKGSLVAQNPEHFHSLEELTHDDKEALAYERAHKWSGPFALYFTGLSKSPRRRLTISLCLRDRRSNSRMGSDRVKRS